MGLLIFLEDNFSIVSAFSVVDVLDSINCPTSETHTAFSIRITEQPHIIRGHVERPIPIPVEWLDRYVKPNGDGWGSGFDTKMDSGEMGIFEVEILDNIHPSYTIDQQGWGH